MSNTRNLIPLFKVAMSPNINTDVLYSGYVGQGDIVDEFEQKLSHYIGNPFINTVNSATSGLHLCLHTIKDNIRDEVLTCPLSCAASHFPIIANDLNIKWVDIGYDCNIDLLDLRRKVNSNTLAILLVHWGGYPVDLDEVKSIQEDCFKLHGHKPYVIEDCAHAFGAKYKSKLLGNHGNLCVFSFQAIKHLTSVDGGMIVSPDITIHNRIKLMRWYGLDRNFFPRYEQDISEFGFKFHMNDLNASIGIQNLELAKTNLEKHRENNNYLRSKLCELPGIQLLEQKLDRISSCWVMTLLVEKRDNFMKHMISRNIEVSKIHNRNDKHSCLKEFRCLLPQLDNVCSKHICIPCGWWLEKKDLDYIVESVKDFYYNGFT